MEILDLIYMRFLLFLNTHIIQSLNDFSPTKLVLKYTIFYIFTLSIWLSKFLIKLRDDVHVALIYRSGSRRIKIVLDLKFGIKKYI